MIYVFEGGSVVYDGNTITEEQKAQAVEVEVLPQAEVPKGHYAILKADKKTNTVYYEYIEDAEITKLNVLLDDVLTVVEENNIEIANVNLKSRIDERKANVK